MTSGTRFATVAILGTVFVSGGLLGALVDRQFRPVGEPTEEAAVEQRGERPERRLIVDEVGLSPDQKVQVDSIVAVSRATMKELRQRFDDEYNPLYRQAVVDTREAIKGVLTDDQRAEYDRLLEENAERRRRRNSKEDGTRK